MCRFVAYLGEPIELDALLLRPSNSLVNQSLDAREFRLRVNGDGFGVAWYPAHRRKPVRFRTVTPAWNNQNLRSFAPAMTSQCIIAHVRAASPGLPVVETNCHPFVSGNLSFCHNGLVGDFPASRRALLRELSDEAFDGIEGTTDSEILFAFACDELRACGGREGRSDASLLATALARAACRVTAIAHKSPSYLNLVLTDGSAVAVLRYSTDPSGAPSSLYLHRGRRYTCEGDVCRMIDDRDSKTTIVASERLSSDPGWEAFPVGQVAAFDADGSLEIRPVVE